MLSIARRLESIRLLAFVFLFAFLSLAMCARSASLNALPSVAVAAFLPQADAAEDSNQDAGRGPFRRYFFRGLEVPQLLDLSQTELLKLLHARARRVFSRGMSPAHVNLIKRLRKAKKAAGADGKPETIKVCFIFQNSSRPYLYMNWHDGGIARTIVEAHISCLCFCIFILSCCMWCQCSRF